MQTHSSIRRFGTFGGVFVPNVLTILGVIFFMRAGWVVGQAGLLQALLILCIANTITLLTSLSLSAIATNARVEAGGAYHLISRSLGIEIGSSIGVPFFFAQSISVAFYLVGFTESLQPFLGAIDARWVGLGALSLIVLLAWNSSDLAIKAQYVILVILGIALLSFFLGFAGDSQVEANWQPNYSEGFQFWTVFAIYFPAVTGIMSGLSMSGELKDPARSIPRGTLVAVGVTFMIYAAQMVWLAHNNTREALLSDPKAVWNTAVYGPAIFAGVWAATLSSAIASLLGAPRTLQALARDRVAPPAIAVLSGSRGEPRRALALSAVVAAVCISIGDLNTIAPIITMFFLSTYGMINFAAFVEGWSCNPSYRPKFKVHWVISLIGALGSLAVMVLLNPIATVIATVIIFSLYLWLASRQFESAWGDSWSGFWFNMTRTALRKFAQSRQHIRNWRPVILVLSGNPATRHSLVSFANHFECKRGYLFIARILVGDLNSRAQERDVTLSAINRFIVEEGLTGSRGWWYPTILNKACPR
jgi:amino acid transporter